MMRYRAHLSLAITFGLLALSGSSGSWAASDRNGSAGAVPEIRPAAAGPRRSFGFRRLLPNVSITPEGFSRLELGYPVADWFPVDLYGNGTWDLAIQVAGTPTRVGVFDLRQDSWIDGPRPIPAQREGWGVGDWNYDGRLEYAYFSGSSIRYLDTQTGEDSVLWKADFAPIGLFAWGHTSSGAPALALKKSAGYYLDSGGRSWWKVYDLLTGASLKSLDGGVSSLRLIAGYPGVPHGNAIVLHESHSTFDNRPMEGIDYYLQSLWLLDDEWNVVWGAELPWASDMGVPKPPWLLVGVDYLPPSPTHTNGGRLFWLTESGIEFWMTYPLSPWMGCLSDTDYVWSKAYYDYTGRKYAGLATYDFRVPGRLEVILPLWHTTGWELRNVNTGAIIDTVPNMPKADLRTGPLFSRDQRDLFYVADSGLYIWGTPTWTFSDPEPTDAVAASVQLAASPNPFVTTVKMVWNVDAEATALDIFNILGQRIRSYDFAPTGGSHTSIEWDGTDIGGRSVPSGLYFARLSGSGRQVVTKLVLLK